jgi:hypothetical protein
MLLAALSVGVAVGCAGTKEAKKDIADVTPGVENRQDGVVSAVDETSISVTPADRPQAPPIRFAIDEDTRVKQGDQTVDRSAIEEGEAVRVSFEPRAGNEKAKAVEILEGDDAARVRARAETAPPAWPKPERSGGTVPAPMEPAENE